MSTTVALFGLLFAQQEVTTNVGGEVGIHFVYRDHDVEEMRNRLNGAPAAEDGDSFFSGPVRLQVDFTWEPDITGLLELGNRTMDGGSNRRFAASETDLNVLQAYVELRRFPSDRWTVRAGVQPLEFTNRYQDDSFFLDLAHSESAWTGLGASGISTTADRDTLEPVGIRVWYDAAIFLKIQAFAFTVVEGGAVGADESVTGIQASVKPSDDLTIKGITTLFSGPNSNSSVWTIGFGIARSLADSWLLAGEVYPQFGRTASGVDKRAWAASFSVRTHGEGWWAEAGLEFASGDDPNDPDDAGWQSYENVNRFAIVQSAEFGLDWDTNYRLVRVAVEVWRVRLDAGWFSIPEEVPGVLPAGRDNLGIEIDARVTWPIDPATSFFAQAAGLMDSDLEDTWLGIVGTQVTF